MRYFKYILTTVLLVCLFFNFHLFQSLIVQQDLINEFNTQSIKSETLEKLENLNINFPNVTITALPLRTIKANYLYRFGRVEEALELLNSKVIDNQYIHYNDYLKSQIYYELKDIDSSKYYAQQAYYNLPQNPLHFERLAFAYAYEGQYDSITKSFNYVNHKDIQIWKLYLLTMLNNPDENSNTAKLLAIKAKDLFPQDNEILIYSNTLLYGEQNIFEAKRLAEIAEVKYENSDFNSSAKLYEKATTLNPGMYSYFENAAAAFSEIKEYEKALKYSSIVIDSFNISTGKSEFIKAISLIKLNNEEDACPLFRVSYKKGFEGAYPFLNKYCN